MIFFHLFLTKSGYSFRSRFLPPMDQRIQGEVLAPHCIKVTIGNAFFDSLKSKLSPITFIYLHRFSADSAIASCGYANFFGPHLNLEHTEAGKGLFWMGLNGLGGTLSKLIVSIRPQEYETLKTQDLGDQAAMETEYSDRQTTEFETSYE